MKRREALKQTALIGGTAALSTSFLTLLQSCKDQPRLNWQPVFLRTEHARLVSALVDTWLPKTETPGGLDVKVDMFIDLVYARVYDEEARQAVVEEMEQLHEKCVTQSGKAFYELDEAHKQAFLQEEEANTAKFNPKVWGTTVGEQEPVGFYRSLKSMALWGYFTSEEIGKNVLNYDPIPGEFKGCIPFSEVGTIWSL